MPPTFEQVVGVPVTLNGDLKNQFVETTVGFDTICKVGTAEMLNSHHYACSLCLYGDSIIFVACIVCYCVLWAVIISILKYSLTLPLIYLNVVGTCPSGCHVPACSI